MTDNFDYPLRSLIDVQNNVILVWNFEDAPEALRKLSHHGGDEDGICWIPAGVYKPYWIEKLWNIFGEPDYVNFTDGQVVIWAHA